MQVSFSSWFQDLFSNFQSIFDVFWIMASFLGEATFFIIIACFTYWCLNKRQAMILLIAYFSSKSINLGLKELCKMSRPIMEDGIRFVEVDNIFISTKDLASTYSFPSAHAMLASTSFFSLGFYLKNKKVWLCAIIFTILVCLSRVYLGVSFIIDVSIGALLGIILAYFIYRLFMLIKEKDLIVYIIMAIGSLIYLIFAKSIEEYSLIGAIIGFVVGAIIERKFINFSNEVSLLWKKVLRIVLGLVLIFSSIIGLKYLFNLIDEEIMIFHSIRYFIVSIIGVVVYPLIFKKINL